MSHIIADCPLSKMLKSNNSPIIAEVHNNISRQEYTDGLLEFYVLATSKVIRYLLVTVCTHGDFIELPHWEIRLQAPCSNSHSVTLSLCSPINAKRQDMQ